MYNYNAIKTHWFLLGCDVMLCDVLHLWYAPLVFCLWCVLRMVSCDVFYLCFIVMCSTYDVFYSNVIYLWCFLLVFYLCYTWDVFNSWLTIHINICHYVMLLYVVSTRIVMCYVNMCYDVLYCHNSSHHVSTHICAWPAMEHTYFSIVICLNILLPCYPVTLLPCYNYFAWSCPSHNIQRSVFRECAHLW